VTESALKKSSGATSNNNVRWLLLRTGASRVCRWFVCSVVLAAAPILISFFALPKTSSMTSFLSHGDFAVLAAALAAASFGELIGPSEPQKWIRNILLLSCLTLFTFTILLLAGIAGNYARLSAPLEARFSWVSFIIAALIGAASWAATVERPHRIESNKSSGSPQGTESR
jgi:hypothetical protein